MGVIAKVLDSAREKIVSITAEVYKGFNRKAVLYTPIGEDSVPCKDDRILMVKVDGTGKYVVVGTLNVSQGAKPGEKILYSRNADGDVKAVIKLLEDGKIKVNAPDDIEIDGDKKIKFKASEDIEIDSDKKVKVNGGGKKAARKGDRVKVQIPAGSVIISVSGGSGSPAVGVPNLNPIDCMGDIQAGSESVEIG